MPTPQDPKPIKTVIDATLELRYVNYVKLAFVRVLRAAFAHECTPEEYRYNTDTNKSHIAIYRAFPKKSPKYPALLVQTAGGEAGPTSLGNEEVYERFDLDTDELLGKVVAGQLWLPTSITILAETTTDREKLTDLVTIYMRYVFMGFFQREQLSYLRVDAGEDGEEVIGARRIFKGKVSTRVQVEFDQFIDQSLFDLIETISLKDVRYGSKESDLQSNNEPEDIS